MTELIFDQNELEGRGRFTGVIISAEVSKGRQFEPDREPRDQLVLTIRPTSYDGNDRKAYYPVSKKKESRWGAFVSALNNLGIVPRTADELVGKEFIWEMQDISVGYDRATETERIVRNVTLPIEFVGERDVSEMAGEVPPVEEVDMTEGDEADDLPTQIQQLLEKEGAMTKKEIASALGTTVIKVTKAVAQLKKDKKVTVEDGAVILEG